LNKSFHDLERLLQGLSEVQPFQVSWAIINLGNGDKADRNGDTRVPAASTRKIAILIACLRLVASGRLDFEQRVVIEARHQINDSGCVRFLRPNLPLTLLDALTLMIVVSDNSCTAAIMEMVGLEAVDRFSRDVGMTQTRHVASAPAKSLLNEATPDDFSIVNSTSANDMCRLLAAVVAGTSDESAAAGLGCTPPLCRLALDIMAGQQLRCGLPRLLPTGTRIAHKTGAGPSNESDVGVIYRGDAPLFAA
jgi:beta-lactamase class A